MTQPYMLFKPNLVKKTVIPNANAKSLKLAVKMTGEQCVVDNTGDFVAPNAPKPTYNQPTALPQTS